MEPVCCIGARIGTLRRRRGLTQKELAKRIGRSVNAVSALERGRNKPTYDILRALAGTLGVSMRDFFAPAGGDADSPRQAALCSEMLDTARTLPPAELELTVRIVAVVARWYTDDR